MTESDFAQLTEQEKEFCELFVHGDDAGDALLCYIQAFKADNNRKQRSNSARLIQRVDIQAYINFLDCPEEMESFEARHLRRKITKKLLKIADACAEDEYVDRKGRPISPASLRSVSVHAYKVVADLNGLNKKQSTNDDGIGTDSGKGKAGITFNVIVPSAKEVVVEQEDSNN